MSIELARHSLTRQKIFAAVDAPLPERRRLVDTVLELLEDESIDLCQRSELAKVLFDAAPTKIPDMVDLCFRADGKFLEDVLINAIGRQRLRAQDPAADGALHRLLIEGGSDQRGIALLPIARRKAPQDMALLEECAASSDTAVSRLAQEFLERIEQGRPIRWP